MHAGLLTNMPEPGVFMTDLALSRSGFQLGSYVTVQHDERGTSVSRRLRGIRTDNKTRDDYLYMDEESFRYMGTDLHDELTITPAVLPMDCP